MERTFVAIKPNGVKKGLIGEIIHRFERKGIKIVAMKMLQLDEEMAGKHYAEHKDKPFFHELVAFITSGPIVAMVLEGESIITVARKMMGATNPQNADAGTIRFDYAQITEENMVHGIRWAGSAKREITLFFGENLVK